MLSVNTVVSKACLSNSERLLQQLPNILLKLRTGTLFVTDVSAFIYTLQQRGVMKGVMERVNAEMEQELDEAEYVFAHVCAQLRQRQEVAREDAVLAQLGVGLATKRIKGVLPDGVGEEQRAACLMRAARLVAPVKLQEAYRGLVTAWRTVSPNDTSLNVDHGLLFPNVEKLVFLSEALHEGQMSDTLVLLRATTSTIDVQGRNLFMTCFEGCVPLPADWTDRRAAHSAMLKRLWIAARDLQRSGVDAAAVKQGQLWGRLLEGHTNLTAWRLVNALRLCDMQRMADVVRSVADGLLRRTTSAALGDPAVCALLRQAHAGTGAMDIVGNETVSIGGVISAKFRAWMALCDIVRYDVGLGARASPSVEGLLSGSCGCSLRTALDRLFDQPQLPGADAGAAAAGDESDMRPHVILEAVLKDTEDTGCPVCFSPLEREDGLVTYLRCSTRSLAGPFHVICTPCASGGALRPAGRCPLCRQDARPTASLHEFAAEFEMP